MSALTSDQDRGLGDVTRFSAEDLERVYHLGGCNPEARILGRALNTILRTDRYDGDRWYVLTRDGVKHL